MMVTVQNVRAINYDNTGLVGKREEEGVLANLRLRESRDITYTYEQEIEERYLLFTIIKTIKMVRGEMS